MRGLINSDVLPAGTALPPERILCREYGVSRMTLRGALDLLEGEGLIQCQRGRPTFVSSDRIQKQLQEMRSFSEEIAQRGATPSSKLLSLRVGRPPLRIREFLGLPTNELIYRIQRLRLSNQTPIAVETSHIPVNLCSKLERFDLEHQSIYRILEENYGISLRRSIDEISAVPATREYRKLLSITGETAILLIQRKSYGVNNTPVEWALSAYRGDLYSAIVRSVRAQ
jgi:GntR family transcriptional regulator